MTPLRIRLYFLAFVGLAAAITFNALYLQEAPQFTGTSSRSSVSIVEDNSRSTNIRTAPTAALPKKRTELQAREDVHAEKPAKAKRNLEKTPRKVKLSKNAAPSHIVKGVQRELNHQGYGSFEMTGLLDNATRAGIVAYQFDQGVVLTGEASEELLKALIFSAATASSRPRNAARFERNPKVMTDVQDILAKLGYGAVTSGRADRRTRQAIRKFESDRNLQGSGRVTPQLLLEMVTITGQSLGGPAG